MVIRSVVAKRYCDALFASAQEAGTLDQVQEDLQKLLVNAKSNLKLYKLIISKVLPKVEKQKVWDKILDGEINKLVKNFVSLLIRYNRLESLELAIEMFTGMYKKHKGVKPVTISSAVALSTAQKKEIANELKTTFGGNIEISEKIDASLISGIVIQVESKMLDLSLKARLDKIKRHIINVRV